MPVSIHWGAQLKTTIQFTDLYRISCRSIYLRINSCHIPRATWSHIYRRQGAVVNSYLPAPRAAPFVPWLIVNEPTRKIQRFRVQGLGVRL